MRTNEDSSCSGLYDSILVIYWSQKWNTYHYIFFFFFTVTSAATSIATATEFTTLSSAPSSAPSSDLTTGAKASIGVGVVLLAVLTVLLVVVLIDKRRRNQHPLAERYSQVALLPELQAERTGSYAMPELPSGVQMSELKPREARAETREVNEIRSSAGPSTLVPTHCPSSASRAP
jgi:hypothetical protein